MNSLPVYRNLTSIILAACCAFGIATARAQTYTVTDLGVLPDQTSSTAAAVNERGQATGTSGNSAFSSSDESPMTDIGTAGHNISHGLAINTAGQVAGDSTFGSEVSHATLFENGSSRDLAFSENPALVSRANSINASGQVAGTFRVTSSGQFRAFFTNTSATELRPVLTDIGTLGGSHAQALAINDSGFVTGNSELFGPYSVQTPGITHAFLWHPSSKKMEDIGTLGGDYSYGTGINANNHVVGYSTLNNQDDRMHAFLQDGTEMRDLGSLDDASATSDRSFALGVNSADQVVGYSYVPLLLSAVVYPPMPAPVEQVAFLCTQGTMRDLNTLIGNATKRYRLYSATAINERGQITAIALEQSTNAFHAVLLTPSLDNSLAKPRPVIRKSGSVQVSNLPAVQPAKTQSGKTSTAVAR